MVLQNYKTFEVLNLMSTIVFKIIINSLYKV